MWSGLPRHIRTSAHDWGQVLTFQGKSCSLSKAFTTRRILGLSGYVTQLKFVEGKIPDQLEKRLGLRKGELGNGAIIERLDQIPKEGHFELRSYTQRPDGRAYEPGEKYPPGTGAPQWQIDKNQPIRATMIGEVKPGEVLRSDRTKT